MGTGMVMDKSTVKGVSKDPNVYQLLSQTRHISVTKYRSLQLAYQSQHDDL